MNQKGFTLVELIAMMVVIAVLMAITIPNISGIIKNNRESIGVEDVNKMVGNAKTKIETGKIKTPAKNECVVMSLEYLDSNNDFKTGINSGTYDKQESIIVITKKQISGATNEYKYYMRLVEQKGNQYYISQNKSGVVKLIDYDEFAKDPEKNGPKITNFTDDMHFYLNNGATDAALKQKINSMNSGLCNSVVGIYTD